MVLLKYESLLLLFLGVSTSLASVDKCVSQKGLDENVAIDCESASISLDRIMADLLGEGNSFTGNVWSPGTEDYEHASHQYASARVKTEPSFIVEAMSQSEVRAAVIFASACDHKITARSGGHSYVGSSSCDKEVNSCLQLDVGNIAHINVSEGQVNVGPGVTLDTLYPVLNDSGIFIPSGECGSVCVGGHMQTGGFGPWSRQLGRFNNYVSSFDIVLADGSLMSVTTPEEGVSSKLNDDIWHAVLGGASGSFGVIVDINFTPVDEADHQALFWEVNFLYNDDTKQCIKNMLREFAVMLEDDGFKNDSRWNIWFTTAGFKYLIAQGPLAPLAFNYFQLDFSWVVPSSPDNGQAFVDANEIYKRLLSAYKKEEGCYTLDEYFDAINAPGLKDAFPSTYASDTDTKSMSEIHNNTVLFDWHDLRLEDARVPFKSSFQSGPQYPSARQLLDIFDHIDALIPVDVDQDKRLVVSQIITLPGLTHSNAKIAQPFQDDVFGVSFDVWSFDRFDYAQDQRAMQDVVIDASGGVDHRMFWAAYGDTCLECGTWEKYYENRPAYNKLTQIKRCVDPNNLFKFRMSMPTNPLNENNLF